LIAHACSGCTRLFYPEPGPDARPLRCDAAIIRLAPADVTRAADEGKARAERHGTRKRKDRFVPLDRVDNDVQAVGAELAVAQLFGLTWTGGAELDVDGDVGTLQVRWSRTPNLMLQRKQRGIYVFVTGKLPVYTVHGWIDAIEALVPDRWDETLRLPAYVVPAAELHDLRRLRRHYERRVTLTA
jgi:hypothetical protein